MTPADIRPGRTYRIGRGCGVPYEWAPLTLRVIRITDAPRNGNNGWIEGYELDPTGRAVARREIYIGQVSGMQEQPAEPTPPAARPVRHRPTNAGPARIPRPRTSPETTTPGRTR
jgi:hypothetical protein